MQFLQLANRHRSNSIPMRKASLLSFLLILYSLSGNTQVRLGILAGGHQSSIIQDDNRPYWGTGSSQGNYKGRTGFHAGFLADIPFKPSSKLFFQPGITFYTKGGKYEDSVSGIAGFDRNSSTQFINYVDVPLNLVLKFGNKTKILIGGGPYLGFFYNGKESYKRYPAVGSFYSEENEDPPVGNNPGQYRVLNFGVNALAGVEIGRVFITANYSRGLNDFYEAKNFEGGFKHQVIGGTLGIFIGKPVKVESKPKDSDKDGVPDIEDQCPTEPGTALTNGCPDKDGDGIADKDDKCPDEAGTKANNGCPIIDTDLDGINDNEDKCPDVPGLKRYDGCPIPDSDRDGINDEDDKCPDVIGYGRYNGCPVPDSDGDGINDEKDKCPDKKGIAENDGCPEEVKKELVEKVNYAARRIQFQTGKAVLLPQSLKVLNDVVDLLNQNPELTLMIEGHTSRDGTFESNMKLSEERAASVLKYLISKKIDASRLTSKGFGPTKPLNEGRTAAERAENRRVELKLSN